MVEEPEKVLEAFIYHIPPGEAWVERGIVSASIFKLDASGGVDSNGSWALVVLFQSPAYFKYIPEVFGQLRVVKRAVEIG